MLFPLVVILAALLACHAEAGGKVFVECLTTKGPVNIVLVPEWAPRGVKRFLELVDDKDFFMDLGLHRCVDNFLCQFGAKRGSQWDDKTIPDDDMASAPKPFKRGYISFAGNGVDSRSSHLFVTLGKHVSSLGRETWETPIGYVEEVSMATVVSKWTTQYGDMPPWGKGPDPGQIARQGNDYLKNEFPELDYWKGCRRRENVEDGGEAAVVKPALRAAATAVASSPEESKAANRFVLKLAPDLGDVVIELDTLAPIGAARLLDMLTSGYLNEARFFRVIPGFVVQFGLPSYPGTAKQYSSLKDDPVVKSNVRGTISFASAGPDTRSNQLFINTGDNQRLDGMGFAPVAKVISGMEFVDKINSKYGEKPVQGMITREGLKYLNKNFPDLSFIDKVNPVETAVASLSSLPAPDSPAAIEEEAPEEPLPADFAPDWKQPEESSSPVSATAAFVFLAVIFLVLGAGARAWRMNVVRLASNFFFLD